MKSLKSLVSAGATLFLATGCVTNRKYTSPDTSRLSNKAMNALEAPSPKKEYFLPTQLQFDEKERLARQYANLPNYSGEVYIFNSSGKLHTHVPLTTTGPLNNQYGTIKAIQDQIPAGAQTYSFNLAPKSESARRQLSQAVFYGLQNFTTNPHKSAVRIDIKQKDSIKRNASDAYTITLTFGETNLSVNHKIIDVRTLPMIGAAGGIGYLIAGIPGAVGVGGFEAASSVVDYANGGKLPANTRVVEKTFNAGNLEGKIGATYDILAQAKGDIIVFPHQYGTAVIAVNNPKAIIVGPNAEANLNQSQISFKTSRAGFDTCWKLFGYAARAGAIKIGTVLNEDNNLNGILTGSGGRTSGSGGTPASSGGRFGEPGGGP